MATTREEVPAALDGQRIDRVVAMLTGVTRAEAARLVTDGAVLIDGEVWDKGSLRLRTGHVVELDVPVPEVDHGLDPESGVVFAVVHEDPDVIVVDKPAGLVVHPGAGQDTGTLAAGLLGRYPELAGVGDPHRPGLVHRLDKGTSGLLVVARTSDAYDDLVAQLSARTVEREYLSLVWGHLESPQGLIDAPIGRSARQPTKMGVSTSGREARTRYEVLERFSTPAPTTLVVCRLETGRTHQIRVHLAAIGHAVVGDDRYDGIRPSLPSPRPFLHAQRLGFRHPRTGEPLSFESPRPADLEAVLALVS